jgi:hypothetical protein
MVLAFTVEAEAALLMDIEGGTGGLGDGAVAEVAVVAVAMAVALAAPAPASEGETRDEDTPPEMASVEISGPIINVLDGAEASKPVLSRDAWEGTPY